MLVQELALVWELVPVLVLVLVLGLLLEQLVSLLDLWDLKHVVFLLLD